jgi:two-component system nitrate/nitrite response regulator NarL
LVAEMLARVVDAEDDFELAATCRDGEAALDAILEHSADVALVDVAMPDRTGPEIAGDLQRARARTRVLFISGSSDPKTVRDCAASGGHGFVGKTAERATIVAAIRTVANGGTVFPSDGPPALRGLSGPRDARVGLTLRERRVLQLAAEGLSTAEISSKLYIGQTTVKTHLRHAADKLLVSGKAATIAEAMRRGLIA